MINLMVTLKLTQNVWFSRWLRKNCKLGCKRKWEEDIVDSQISKYLLYDVYGSFLAIVNIVTCDQLVITVPNYKEEDFLKI